MLVLGRKPGESIDVIVEPSDRTQVIRFVQIDHARVGVVADESVRIVRTELLERAAS